MAMSRRHQPVRELCFRQIASANEITALQKTIRDELNDVVSNIDYVSKQDFYDNTFTKQYPNGEFQGRTLTADDMQDSLWLKLKDPTKYQVVSEVLSGKEGVEDVTDQRQIFDRCSPCSTEPRRLRLCSPA